MCRWLLSPALGVLLAAVPALGQSPVQIKGATAPDDRLNGVYRPSGQTVNGRTSYKRDGGADFWLSLDSNGFWSVQPLAQRGSGSGYMISATRNAGKPEDSAGWTLWRDGAWRVVPEVQVVPAVDGTTSTTVSPKAGSCALTSLGYSGVFQPLAKDAEQIRVDLSDKTRGTWQVYGKTQTIVVSCLGSSVVFQDELGGMQLVGQISAGGNIAGQANLGGQPGGHFLLNPYPVSSTTNKPSVFQGADWTLATTALCFFAVLVALAAAGYSRVAYMRHLTFHTLSTCLSNLAGYTLNAAVLALLFKRPVGAEMGRGGTNMPEAIVVPILFVVAYLVLTVFAWKFLYSQPRLTVKKALGAAIVGILGGHVVAQWRAEFHALLAPKIQNAYLEPFLAAAIPAVLMAALVAGLRFASQQLRGTKLKDAPAEPWPAPKAAPAPPPSSPEKTRFCTPTPPSCLGRGDASPSAAAAQPCDWKSDAWDAEDEVARIVGAFALYQVLDGSPLTRWLATVGVPREVGALLMGVLISLVGIFALRSRLIEGKPGRVPKIVVGILLRAVGLAMVWALLASLAVLVFVRGVPELWTAIILSLVAVLSLALVLQMGLEAAPAATTGTYGLLLAGEELPQSSGGAPFVVTTFGFLLAFAWSLVLLCSLQEVAASTSRDAPIRFLEEGCLALIAGAFLVLAWYSSVLPQAEMAVDKHGEVVTLQQLPNPA